MSRAESVSPHPSITAVRGAVIDVTFPQGPLPQINEALRIEWDRKGEMLAEVQSHLDAHTVRAIALQATAGLSRGTTVAATGAPITVPVGSLVTGPAARRDRRDSRWRSFTATGNAALADPSRAAQTGAADGGDRCVRDRHQGAGPAHAAGAGRQGGDVRWRGCGQDGPGDGTDPRHGGAVPGHFGLCGYRREVSRRARTADRHARLRRARTHRSRLWPDERTARCALARRTDRAHHGRVLPRPRAPQRASADGQCVSLCAGRQRGFRFAGKIAVACGLSTDAGHGSCGLAGTHRISGGRCDHCHRGGLRARGRFHRSRGDRYFQPFG